ncbi:MAG: trehalose-phosphatase [Thermomicrobiales bacterium]
MSTDLTPVPDVVVRILDVLAQMPSALLSDFDGTLSPIAPTPEGAFLHPDLVHVLPELVTREPLFGIITGRAVADARHKLGVDEMLVVGNHGLEWFDGGAYRAHPAGLAAEQSIVDALAGIEEDLKALDRDLTGMVFENKRLSASIHYRLVADPETFDEPLAAITQRRADEFGLRMTTGKMMVELRPMARVSKGSAVEEIVTTHGLRGAVFLGDDVTDVDAFLAITRLRESGVLAAGLSVGVLSADSHPAIAETADVLVRDVNEVAAIMIELAQRLPTRSGTKDGVA